MRCRHAALKLYPACTDPGMMPPLSSYLPPDRRRRRRLQVRQRVQAESSPTAATAQSFPSRRLARSCSVSSFLPPFFPPSFSTSLGAVTAQERNRPIRMRQAATQCEKGAYRNLRRGASLSACAGMMDRVRVRTFPDPPSRRPSKQQVNGGSPSGGKNCSITKSFLGPCLRCSCPR